MDESLAHEPKSPTPKGSLILAGGLSLVATPIGNLGDISARALEALRSADVIAAEDTRRTRQLLSAFGIPAGQRLVAYFRENERAQADHLVDAMRGGQSVALVTDAGSPSVSDPGEYLVQACIAADLPVTAVPGPSAPIAALAMSGLPAERFSFEGFLPRKSGQRQRQLDKLVDEERTMLFFEAPYRLAATLAAMREAFGADRQCAVCRELTKLHEEVIRGTLDEVCERFGEKAPKGEIVIVVAGAAEPSARGGEVDTELVKARVAQLLNEGLSVRDVAAAAAADLAIPKKLAYQLALEISRSTGG